MTPFEEMAKIAMQARMLGNVKGAEHIHRWSTGDLRSTTHEDDHVVHTPEAALAFARRWLRALQEESR